MTAAREAAVEAARSDPEPRVVETARGPVAITDEGPPEGIPVLAVHGIPGSVRDFRYLAPPLVAHGFRVIRVDLPGFGASPPEARAIRSLEGRAAVLIALADALALPRFVPLGHSMGGGAALVTAAAHPQRVRALALLSSIGLRRHRGLPLPPPVFRALARAMAVPGLGDGLARATRATYRRLGFRGTDGLDRAALRLQMQAIGAADFALLRRAAGAEPLPPALVAWAEDDHIVQPEISEALLRATRGRPVAFPSGGHHIQKTRAAEVADALAGLVDDSSQFTVHS